MSYIISAILLFIGFEKMDIHYFYVAALFAIIGRVGDLIEAWKERK